MAKRNLVKKAYRTAAALLLTLTMLAGITPANVYKASAAGNVKTETGSIWRWRKVTNFDGYKPGTILKCLVVWKDSNGNQWAFAGEEGGITQWSSGFTGMNKHLKVNENEILKDKSEFVNVNEFFTNTTLPSAYIKIETSSAKSLKPKDYPVNPSGEANRFRLYTNSGRSKEMYLPGYTAWTSMIGSWSGSDVFGKSATFHLVAADESGKVRLALPVSADAVVGGPINYNWRLMGFEGAELTVKNTTIAAYSGTPAPNFASTDTLFYFWVGESIDCIFTSGELAGQTFYCDRNIIHAGQTLTVEKDGVLVVNGLLLNGGKLINKGTVIVCNGGGIAAFSAEDDSTGMIVCDGSSGQGNLIVCKDGYVGLGLLSGPLVLENGASMDNEGTMVLPVGVEIPEEGDPDNSVTIKNKGTILTGTFVYTGDPIPEAIKDLMTSINVGSKVNLQAKKGYDFSQFRDAGSSTFFYITPGFPQFDDNGKSCFINEGNCLIHSSAITSLKDGKERGTGCTSTDGCQ